MEHSMETGQRDVRFTRLCALMAEELAQRPIPGVVLGVSDHGAVSLAGFGVTSVEHPLAVDAGTLYQIGSITKTFTATALMRLVEQGRLELDAPLRNYLPDLRLRDEQVAARVTLRHLLTHTGGWAGDYFDDTGAGDDALAKMVRQVGALPQVTPLGALFSYNNAGFYLAGRVLEIITGQRYADALGELVLAPLGLTHAYLTADDVMTHRFAVGHFVVDRQPQVARPWAMPRCLAPVGGIICDMADVLRYAQFHMGDGTNAEGARVLTRASLDAMHTPLLASTGDEWVGLSWFMQDVDGTRILRHTGGTKGQQAHLSLIPAHQFALGIFTNSGEGSTLYDRVRRAAYRDYAGLDLPTPAPLDVPPEQLAAYAGRYQAAMDDCDVRVDTAVGGRLLLQEIEKGGFPTPATPPPPQPPLMHMAFYRADGVLVLDGPSKNTVGEFGRGPDGSVAWLRLGSRVHMRVEES